MTVEPLAEVPSISGTNGFPAPPPWDSLTVTMTVKMTDGREASASAPLVIVI